MAEKMGMKQSVPVLSMPERELSGGKTNANPARFALLPKETLLVTQMSQM